MHSPSPNRCMQIISIATTYLSILSFIGSLSCHLLQLFRRSLCPSAALVPVLTACPEDHSGQLPCASATLLGVVDWARRYLPPVGAWTVRAMVTVSCHPLHLLNHWCQSSSNYLQMHAVSLSMTVSPHVFTCAFSRWRTSLQRRSRSASRLHLSLWQPHLRPLNPPLFHARLALLLSLIHI